MSIAYNQLLSHVHGEWCMKRTRFWQSILTTTSVKWEERVDEAENHLLFILLSWNTTPANAGSMFTQRLSIWTSNCPESGVFFLYIYGELGKGWHVFFSQNNHQTRDIDTMLFYCWASVVDAGPTLKQHCVDVWRLLCTWCRVWIDLGDTWWLYEA